MTSQAQLQTLVVEAFQEAEFYGSLNTGLFFLGILAFIVAIVFIVLHFEENITRDMNERSKTVYFTSIGFAAILGLLSFLTVIIIPSEDSKLLKAYSLTSQLDSSAGNKLFLKHLSNEYDGVVLTEEASQPIKVEIPPEKKVESQQEVETQKQNNAEEAPCKGVVTSTGEDGTIRVNINC